ncbi:MAG: hypothetical protein WCJ99_01905 [Betaproteobacteria bacterium]
MNRFNLKSLAFEVEQFRAQATDQNFQADFVKRSAHRFTAQFIDQIFIGGEFDI